MEESAEFPDPATDTSILFPEHLVVDVHRELNAWVAIRDVLRAAQILEGKIAPDEQISEHIIISVPNDDHSRACYSFLIRFLIEAFQCPESKILLALELNSDIGAESLSKIRSCRFAPHISIGRPEHLSAFVQNPPANNAVGFMLIQDEPFILELIYRPLLVWDDIVSACSSMTLKLRDLRKAALSQTGGAPIFYHKPRSDSQVRAVIEALLFYLSGSAVGHATMTKCSVLRGFRSVAISGRPPFDSQLLQIARAAQISQFNDLNVDA